uniref:BURP domain-containing protein n=1 Tax=Oryza punctata TaxID=4537 RepID=A0A0E0L9V1_ORYPU
MKAMGGLLPLIPFLLVIVVAGGNGRTGFSLEGAIVNPAEVKAYWEATLPNTPMPQAVLDILGQLQGQANNGDDRKMEKFYLYNKGNANNGDDQKMGRFYLYNEDQANEEDDQEMKNFYLYNKDKTNEKEDQKMRFYLYNKDQANNGDDQKMEKFYLYNKAHANEGDNQKMGRFYFYNEDQANNGDDQKMGRFYMFNKAETNEGDDQKMTRFYLYNKDQANNGDDQNMGRFYLYNNGQANNWVDQKMEKFYLYNKAKANDRDDQKMGRFYLYNKAQDHDRDDQNMGKFYLYSKGQAKDVVDQKMKKFYLYNKNQDNEMNDQNMGKFYLYDRGQTNDTDGQKLGEKHKHHSHGHGHVHFPIGARDMFFFEDNVAPGSVLTTRILSTRSSSIFLHRNSSKHIPFSMKNFANIVSMFAPVSVTMANDIASTLEACEHPQTAHGEDKARCAASIESFLDIVVSSLGTDNVRALSPEVPMEGVPSLRYTVASATPVTTNSRSILACHDLPYPYKVFFCHMAMQARAYQVSLVSEESGGVPSIDALAVCHLNTSNWDPGHPFFKLMDVKPGETTACHFLGRGSIIWVPAVQEATQ